jgi:uncharacterized protein (TIRG00374 family)
LTKNIRSALKYILFLFIGIGMLWLTFRNQDFGAVVDKIKHVHIGWLLLSVFVAVLAHISRTVRWNMLIEPLGYKPKIINTFWALCAGYFANLAVPRIGEITRCAMLSKAENVPFNELIGTVIVERIMDVIMLLLFLILVATMEFKLIGGFLNENIILPMVQKFQNVSAMQLAIVFFILVAGCMIMYRYLARSTKFSGGIEKVIHLLKGVMDGVKSVGRLKNIPLFIFHTLFIWTMYFFASYFCFFALDATSALDARAGLFILVIGGLGMSAPVQGGIGAYHFIVSRGLMLYNIPETEGIVYATVVHGYQTILVILLGATGFFVLMATNKKSKQIHGL